jgi:mannose-6-phosphate isomerase-like protein (cupin superfamily)
LLLADDLTAPFVAGDIVRFEDGEIHGLDNTGSSPFEYLSVTAPPLNFRAAYAAEWRPEP